LRLKRASFAQLLLDWFARCGRSELPWRTSRTPYRVVVSEFMLQQTQVERVCGLFEGFVAKWPGFEALAAASQADVVRAWKGLGYNSRAVRLHRLAKIVTERFGGELPRGERELRELPGVGPYTARAIASFAFDASVVAADTNVRRIVHRTQLGLEWPSRAAPRELDALAAGLIPPGSGYAFNSALMDLGATLCTARAPKCALCPLRSVCVAAPIDSASLGQLAKANARTRSPQERLRFEATSRFVRGRVVDRLRALPPGRRISLLDLYAELEAVLSHHDAAGLDAIVAALARERIVDDVDGSLALAH
jgi:A/G-specific adenine glycosylase